MSTSSVSSFNPSDLASIIYAVNNGECFCKKRLRANERLSSAHESSLLSLQRWHYLVWNGHPDGWRLVYSKNRLHLDETNDLGLNCLYLRDFVNVSIIEEGRDYPYILIELSNGESMVITTPATNIVNCKEVLGAWEDAIFSLLYFQGESHMSKDALSVVKANYIQSLGLPPESISIKPRNFRSSFFAGISGKSTGDATEEAPISSKEPAVGPGSSKSTRRSSIAMLMSAISSFTSTKSNKNEDADDASSNNGGINSNDYYNSSKKASSKSYDFSGNSSDDDGNSSDDQDNSKLNAQESDDVAIRKVVSSVKSGPQRRLSTFCRAEMIRRVSILTYRQHDNRGDNIDDDDGKSSITTTQSQRNNADIVDSVSKPFTVGNGPRSSLDSLFNNDTYLEDQDDNEFSNNRASFRNVIPFNTSVRQGTNSNKDNGANSRKSADPLINSAELMANNDAGDINSGAGDNRVDGKDGDSRKSGFNPIQAFRRASVSVMATLRFKKSLDTGKSESNAELDIDTNSSRKRSTSNDNAVADGCSGDAKDIHSSDNSSLVNDSINKGSATRASLAISDLSDLDRSKGNSNSRTAINNNNSASKGNNNNNINSNNNSNINYVNNNDNNSSSNSRIRSDNSFDLPVEASVPMTMAGLLSNRSFSQIPRRITSNTSVTTLECRVNNILVNLYISDKRNADTTTQAGLYGNRLQWGSSNMTFVIAQVESSYKTLVPLRGIKCAEINSANPDKFRLYLSLESCKGWLYLDSMEQKKVLPFLNYLYDQISR